jgi:hypothetical protein
MVAFFPIVLMHCRIPKCLPPPVQQQALRKLGLLRDIDLAAPAAAL